ncbi:MAG: tetratricopeptide repeat protein [Alphaproteobacteria bacterium]|nr:tetratricopeptide repeat protein [Alphaproteobacteria bacterium]
MRYFFVLSYVNLKNRLFFIKKSFVFRFFICFILYVWAHNSYSQINYVPLNNADILNESQNLFNAENYTSCFNYLRTSVYVQNPLNLDNVHQNLAYYYYIISGIRCRDTSVFELARTYIKENIVSNFKQRVAFFLGNYYYFNNDFENALQYLEHLPIYHLTNKEVSQLKFQLGYIFYKLNNFKKAKHLLSIISQLPQDKFYFEANYYVGLLSISDGSYAEAIKNFKIAEEKSDYKPYIPYYLAQCFYFEKKIDSSLRIANKALENKTTKNTIQLEQLLSQIYFEKNDFQKSLNHFKKFIFNYPEVTANDFFKYSFCFYKTSQYDSALHYLIKIQSSDEQNQAAILNLLANIYIIKNEKQLAKNALYNCIELLNDTNTEFLTSKLNYIKLLVDLKEHSFALVQLQNYLNYPLTDSLKQQALELLIYEFTRSQNYEKAYSVYKKLKFTSKESQKVYVEILIGLGKTEFLENQFDSAVIYLTMALNEAQILNVQKIEAEFWLGQTFYQLEQFKFAIIHTNNYLNLKPTSSEDLVRAYITNGYSFLKLDDFTLALENYNKALKLLKKSHVLYQDALLRKADCNLMLKNFSQASQGYQEVVIQKWAGADYALFQLAKLAGAGQNLDQKIHYLEQLINSYPSSNLQEDAHLELVETYFIQEKFKNAKLILDTINNNINYLKWQAAILYKLGLVHFNLKNNIAALNYFDTLYQKYSHFSEIDDAAVIIKNIFIIQNQPEKYIEFMNKFGILTEENEQEKLLLEIADRKTYANDYEGLVKIYKQYLNLNQPSAKCDILNKIILVYKQLKSLDSALPYLQDITKYCADKTEAWQTIASIYQEHQDYQNQTNSLMEAYQSTSDQSLKQSLSESILNNFINYPQLEYNEDSLNFMFGNESFTSQVNPKLWYIYSEKLSQDTNLDKDYKARIAYWEKIISSKDYKLAPKVAIKIGNVLVKKGLLDSAEQWCFGIIKNYDYDYYVVTQAYLLLGDIYLLENDQFNAKSTYSSVKENSEFDDLKKEATEKLNKITTHKRKYTNLSKPKSN